jgi:signal transduction histidine kinase/ABC-type multidrug transport system ATPase subunit/GAF domain-containing protein
MTAAATSPRQPAPAQLAVSGLGVRFGPLTALDGVDLDVGAGELVALAGENGAGKSTLIRCIAGDIGPNSGQVALDGKPVPPDPISAKRRGISVVWQDLALCGNLDIASNVLLGRERRRQVFSHVRMTADAAALFARLGVPLQDTARSVRSLSGGQRQLVAVARAMADNPRLLLLDEPTSSLGVQESALVEELIMRVRAQGTTVLLACHDINQMFRLADRIAVLRHGRLIAQVAPAEVNPGDVVALVSGQEVDSSARRQLTRLHGLTDRLVSADPSSSLSLILSALGAALGSERLCIHLVEGSSLLCAASLGLAPQLQAAWSRLPRGPAGGPVGLAAVAECPVIEDNVQSGSAWADFAGLARASKVASSWSVPVLGPGGLLGVITVFRATAGRPRRDDLDLATLYAGYAASAIERDRLLDEVTARNRVLETIREMLQRLAGPVPVANGLGTALQALRWGLAADEVALLAGRPDGPPSCRASAGVLAGVGPGRDESGAGSATATGSPISAEPAVPAGPAVTLTVRQAAETALAHTHPGQPDAVEQRSLADGTWLLTVAFSVPGGPAALVARWQGGRPPADSTALLEDAAHSLRLALEREAAWSAHQEAAALRRSRELQRGFLSRLSHELRTPLTAIKGYASSLLQPDVTWDAESEHRFLTRITAESSRLSRLVDDLLRFSAIESGVLQLQRDWCDLPLVLDAAVACLPPDGALRVEVSCADDLPVIWADHDRLEQVFVNLLSNAIGHNPPGTRVTVSAVTSGPDTITVSVADDGTGLPPDVVLAPFEPMRRGRAPGSASGLGLSIARGIVTAHGGQLELLQPAVGTCFRIQLPVENPDSPADSPPSRSDLAGVAGDGGPWPAREAHADA